MQENSLPGAGIEGRTAPRTNLFMAATLHAAGVATPVKIRDMSPEGAQIESPLIPDVGSPMLLVRGVLSVEGRVTWATGRRCGLLFSARVSVPEWMANPANREQQRVDHAVAAVKAGAPPLALVANERASAAERPDEDLRQVSQLLEILGDALAGDPAIVTRHGVTLQNLDIAGQTLTALAESLRAGAPPPAASLARLRELRASCAQALQTKA